MKTIPFFIYDLESAISIYFPWLPIVFFQVATFLYSTISSPTKEILMHTCVFILERKHINAQHVKSLSIIFVFIQERNLFSAQHVRKRLTSMDSMHLVPSDYPSLWKLYTSLSSSKFDLLAHFKTFIQKWSLPQPIIIRIL